MKGNHPGIIPVKFGEITPSGFMELFKFIVDRCQHHKTDLEPMTQMSLLPSFFF